MNKDEDEGEENNANDGGGDARGLSPSVDSVGPPERSGNDPPRILEGAETSPGDGFRSIEKALKEMAECGIMLHALVELDEGDWVGIVKWKNKRILSCYARATSPSKAIVLATVGLVNGKTWEGPKREVKYSTPSIRADKRPFVRPIVDKDSAFEF